MQKNEKFEAQNKNKDLTEIYIKQLEKRYAKIKNENSPEEIEWFIKLGRELLIQSSIFGIRITVGDTIIPVIGGVVVETNKNESYLLTFKKN